MVSAITLLFGVVHGLGFSAYFKNLLSGSNSDKIYPTLSFAIGIEAAQILIVFVVLLLAYFAQSVFRVSKRDFVLVLSSVVIGVVLPMIYDRF